MKMIAKKMMVEIWSDIICVHCYIAKRKFERALAQFQHASEIEIVWKSFELAPGLKVDPRQNMYQFLAEHNKASLEQVKVICGQISDAAEKVGLKYNFDIAIPANSFNAHRLSHLAKHHNRQNEAEEVLFKAHFSEGKDIDNIATLVQLGIEIGLDENEVRNGLESDQYADEVKRDKHEAQQLRISGVPYYLFNKKVAVSGVQDDQSYLKILEKAFIEWQGEADRSDATNSEGKTCKIGEAC